MKLHARVVTRLVAQPFTAPALFAMQEEALEVTGIHDPQSAAKAVLCRPGAKTEWCVVKLGAKGALLVTKSPQQQVYHAGAFQVSRRSKLQRLQDMQDLHLCSVTSHMWL